MIHANVPLVCKNIYIWFVKPISFATPKLYFVTPNAVATHSLRSPELDGRHGPSILCDTVTLFVYIDNDQLLCQCISFNLTCTDDWSPYCAMALCIDCFLLAESYQTINQ